MTSEICGMNRLAVVLAADSATTVTRWIEGKQEERYFKGANKIFQLSDHHPVGIMIFDGADILKVPFELVVKEFRKHLDRKSFNDVAGYASEFFDFISGNFWLFPRERRREAFLEAARTAVLTAIIDRPSNEEKSGDERVAERRSQIDSSPNPAGLDDAWVTTVINDMRADLIASLEGLHGIEGIELKVPENLDALAETAILEVVRESAFFLGTTGIVFAGFGDHDVFPTMLEYQSRGMILDQLIVHHEKSVSIDHELPAWLQAFAQTDMSDTFTLGISKDVYTSLHDSVLSGAETLVNEIATALNLSKNQIPGAQAAIDKAADDVGHVVLERAKKQHAIPLRQVLSVLPVDEMAELAETLINLQALKEKVTKPSETVGGPVDVAVITRSEGLVWIRRKQFFDSAMNSRYMQRQNAKFH